jgi:hypothetical protein
VRLSFAIVAMVCACARTSSEPAVVPGCGDGPSIGGGCIGVSPLSICDDDVCVDGVSCTRVLGVASEATLQSAAKDAVPGDCIAVSPGKYGSIAIAGGVSLLGVSASTVTLGDVRMSFASQATSLVRGVGLRSASAKGKGKVTFDRVLVDGASGVAVEGDETDVTMIQSTVANAASSGVLVDCRAGCPRGARPTLVLERTWVHDARRVAVLAFGVDAVVRDVVIERTHEESFLYGRGLEVSTGGTLQASSLRILDSADAALVVHGSAALLGPDLQIERALRGIWLSAIPDGGVVLDGFAVSDVSVAGLGFDRGSIGIVVRNGSVHGTRASNVPVDVGGSRAIGDGITWGAGVHAIVEPTVRIGHSERLPALIDASAHGSFAAILDDGDDDKGVFLANGTAHPDLAIGEGLKVTYGEPPGAASTDKTPLP